MRLDFTLTELELVQLWSKARWHLIVSQLAPTALLGFTVWLAIEGLADATFAVRIAATGILLASGVLGALAQFSSASEAQAIANDLRSLGPSSFVARRILALAGWAWIVKFLTPTIFVIIFAALVTHLLLDV